MTGLVVGAIRMGLDFAIRAPSCGSGEPDMRWNIVSKVNFLHFAMILSLVSLVVIVAVSMLTEPRPPEKVRTWICTNSLYSSFMRLSNRLLFRYIIVMFAPIYHMRRAVFV